MGKNGSMREKAMNSVKETFLRVVSDVLERFAFVFVEAEEKDGRQDNQGEYLLAVITFKGSRGGGSISLVAQEGLCVDLAANVLGVDASEAGREMAEDALKEMANIICGELAAALYGEKEVYALTIPLLFRIGREKWMEMYVDPDTLRIRVEGKPMLANLVLT
jgi:CheY-specific phosphatase CheX